MMGDLEFDRVYQEKRGYVYPGSLKLRASDVWFRNDKTGLVDHYQAEIEGAEWISRARGQCLKLILTNGNVHRYDGFGESDFEKLKNFIRTNYSCELTKKEFSYKGWNWGKLKISGNTLDFSVDKNTAFELPLNNVCQVKNTKNEVTLEFHQSDDADISLMEMRFHLPPPKETDVVESMADEIYVRVMEKADILQIVGDGIVEFKETHCLQPRGRYDLKLYPTFIHFHGKTFDYKIPLSTVNRMFLLPHRDNRAIFFVLNIDPPIKHGQTRYHFVILQFDKNNETTVELRMPEEELEQKYEGKLTKEMSGPEYEVIARLFKVLIGRKITVPGSFTSMQGSHAISCSYKASTGFLYPLERGFIFVPRPPVHVRFDEITCVHFSRGTGAQRSFDFDLETKTITYTFTSIEKDEYTRLFDYVVSKKLRVLNIDEAAGGQSRSLYEEWSSDEGDHDAYLEKVKREGKKSGVLTIADMGDDDDDDDDDEDFMPPDSGSDVAEEYDSNPETTSNEGGSSTPSESQSSSVSEDDDDEEMDEETREKRKAKKEKKRAKKEKEKQRREKEKERERRKRTEKRREKKSESGGGGGGAGGGGRKRKAPKDKNAPKRPLTAFFLFSNDIREQLRRDNPSFGVAEIGKLAGEKWKALEPAEKEKYQKQHEAAKERYQEEMAEYKRKIESGEIVVEAVPAPVKRSKKAPASDGDSKKAKDKAKESPIKTSFKSAEFVEDSSGDNSSSLDSDSDAEKKKGKAKEEVKEEAASSGDDSDADSESD